jgi:hypothetical protein
MIFLKISSYIQAISSFILFILFIINYSTVNNNFKVIGVLATISTIGNILQEISVTFMNGAYVNQIGEAYQLLLVILISLFFLNLNKTKLSIVLFYILVASCSVCWVLLLVYLNHNFLFSVYSIITYVGLILFAVLYFLYLLKYLPSDNLLAIPEFWIASAVLFNFSGYLIITLSYGYLVEILKENTILYWSMYNLFSVVFFSLLSYALLLHVENVKVTKHEPK